MKGRSGLFYDEKSGHWLTKSELETRRGLVVAYIDKTGKVRGFLGPMGGIVKSVTKAAVYVDSPLPIKQARELLKGPHPLDKFEDIDAFVISRYAAEPGNSGKLIWQGSKNKGGWVSA